MLVARLAAGGQWDSRDFFRQNAWRAISLVARMLQGPGGDFAVDSQDPFRGEVLPLHLRNQAHRPDRMPGALSWRIIVSWERDALKKSHWTRGLMVRYPFGRSILPFLPG